MSFWKGLFETKRADTGSAVSRVVSGSPNAQALGGVGQQQWDIDKAIKDGIEKVIWAFRCVDAIATNACNVPFNIVRGYNHEKQEILDEPRLWKLINYKPNTYETADEFRYRLSSQLLLSRRGAFIEIVRGNDGLPSELHLLPANKVEPIPGTLDPRTGQRRFVDGFKIQGVDMREETLEPERVIWLRNKPHPTDPYLAQTPFLPASLAIEQDYFARLFNNTFMRNDGRPSMIVSVQGNMNTMDAEELKRRFNGSPATAGQVSVIEAEGISVADFTANPRDVQWLEGIKESKDDILLAFGVPESVMGNASGRTFDNADAEYEMFWVHTMVHHVKAIANKMDALTLKIGDDVMIAPDFTKVDVLQRAFERKRQAKANEVSLGLATIDDYLEFIGKEKWDVIGTRILFLPSGIAVAKNPQDQAAITTLKPVGQPAQDSTGISESARQGALRGVAEGTRQWNNVMAARAASLANKSRQALPAVQETKADIIDAEVVDEEVVPVCPYEETRKTMEGTIDGLIVGWSSRYQRVMSERLLHTKVRKGTRHWDGDPGTKALNARYIVQVEDWADELADDIMAAVKGSVLREAQASARDMVNNGLSGTQGGRSALSQMVGDEDAFITAVLAPVRSMITDAAKVQSNKIIATIEDMDRAGASLSEIKAYIAEFVGAKSQWRRGMAIGATTSALESVRASVYGTAGKQLQKTWRSMEDERVRPTHSKVNGKTVAANRQFKVGSALMDIPGDPTAPIGERINCRCWTDYKLV